MTLIIDSGATRHFVTERESLEKNKHGLVEVVVADASGGTTQLKQQGTLKISVKTSDGSKTLDLGSAHKWPGSNKNLVSVRRLTEKGYEVVFSKEGDYLRCPDGSKISLRITKEGLYAVD